MYDLTYKNDRLGLLIQIFEPMQAFERDLSIDFKIVAGANQDTKMIIEVIPLIIETFSDLRVTISHNDPTFISRLHLNFLPFSKESKS
ncbi:uncharacterized protein KGF55_000081 [Candida pseudojiufengensis]|uniref:uncharacterized protein n=1 Tax=Candida pseudojiufengensis TaxID=497109 RepID=UPI0022248858|nr:uncharacterized protein KGF55_000081 [Candida pseudojiufengensis]KAI5967810.1 hypothetical protein KGF55_000081 [Candida pseudojiufengensis]